MEESANAEESVIHPQKRNSNVSWRAWMICKMDIHHHDQRSTKNLFFIILTDRGIKSIERIPIYHIGSSIQLTSEWINASLNNKFNQTTNNKKCDSKILKTVDWCGRDKVDQDGTSNIFQSSTQSSASSFYDDESSLRREQKCNTHTYLADHSAHTCSGI